MGIQFIFIIILLIFSVVLHEVSHGYAAYALGDPTAKLQGRLTLNPLKHLDLFGSIIVPIFGYFLGGFIFGWAKPVPYNPYNLRNQRWGEAFVAAVGPLTNITITVVFGLVIRFGAGSLPLSLVEIASFLVFINLILTGFNLIPIPPLDGSKILFALLPPRFMKYRYELEHYGFFLVLFFIVFFWGAFLPYILNIFTFITGTTSML